MPELLVVLPTIDGREEALERGIEAHETILAGRDFEIAVPKNKATCGEAWAVGTEGKDFDYVLFGADDQIPQEGYLEPLVKAVDWGFLPAPLVLNPDGSVQSAGGQIGAAADLIHTPGPDWGVVDFTPIPFMGKEQWERIGMLPVHYWSDVWVSYRGRQLGIPTVFRKDSRFVHDFHPLGRAATSALLPHHRDMVIQRLEELAA